MGSERPKVVHALSALVGGYSLWAGLRGLMASGALGRPPARGVSGLGQSFGRASFGPRGPLLEPVRQGSGRVLNKAELTRVRNIDERVRYIIANVQSGSLSPRVKEALGMVLARKCRANTGPDLWCLPQGTLILRAPGVFVPIEQIEPGDTIMGDGAWTRVVGAYDTGVKPLLSFKLNNGDPPLRCTADHKLFVVPRRRVEGTRTYKTGRHEDAIEIRAGDVEEGDDLLQPESLPFGRENYGDDRALILGAYIAEGWLEPSRASIAGIPNSKGIREKVIAAAERLGMKFSMDEYKVRLMGREVVAWLTAGGVLAANKRAPSLDVDAPTALAMLTGINADARTYAGTEKAGKYFPTFYTTSQELALQYRILQRMFGRSTSIKFQLDEERCTPCFQVNVRNPAAGRGGRPWARVMEISEEAPEQTYDLETESRRIYLPETDVVVHNCIAEKNADAEIAAWFYAIRQPSSPFALRYTRDHAYVDQFTACDQLLKLHIGDCFPNASKVLRRVAGTSELVRVDELRVGDYVWGWGDWTRVTRWWDRGMRSTWNVRLSNGKAHRLTPDHKVWFHNRPELTTSRIALRELPTGVNLVRPLTARLTHAPSTIPTKPFETADRKRAHSTLRVTDVERDDLILPCCDFETEDHYVYLPEADWTVSQCDDGTALVGAGLMSAGYDIRCRIIQDRNSPSWSHIYPLVNRNPYGPPDWKALDWSVPGRPEDQGVRGRPGNPYWEVPGAEECARTGRPAGMVVAVKDYETWPR